MRTHFSQAGTRTMLSLAVMAVVGWSCTKNEAIQNDPPNSGLIEQARTHYESSASPLTKTVMEQQIAIKPLPGEMTPLWSQAKATELPDEGASWVDVPIEAAITYVAVRGGHHSEEGICDHDHTPVNAVQKLAIYTDAAGNSQSLVMTIVPEPECTVDLSGFTSAYGVEGFSGFASWHDLTGQLVRVADFENGNLLQSVEATEENVAEILEIVDNAILHPSAYSIPSTTKIEDPTCKYCHELKCDAKNDASKHCPQCGKYDDPKKQDESKCVCGRCGRCGRKYKAGMGITECKCGGTVEDKTCPTCGLTLCPHLFPELYEERPPYVPEVVVHEQMLLEIFDKIFSADSYLAIKNGSHGIDVDADYQKAGYEYLHGMFVWENNNSRDEAYTKMRNHFIQKMGAYVRGRNLTMFGEGLHPVLDTYVDLQTRIDMLDYYSFNTKGNIIHGLNCALYVDDPVPCTNAVLYIFNTLLDLPSTATDAQIGAVFDHWEEMMMGKDL